MVPEGIKYEADQRLAELIVKGIGLVAGTNRVVTFGFKVDCVKSDLELDKQKATTCRAMEARGNYLAQDRTDIT